MQIDMGEMKTGDGSGFGTRTTSTASGEGSLVPSGVCWVATTV
jgi:hypothetical protein